MWVVVMWFFHAVQFFFFNLILDSLSYYKISHILKKCIFRILVSSFCCTFARRNHPLDICFCTGNNFIKIWIYNKKCIRVSRGILIQHLADWKEENKAHSKVLRTIHPQIPNGWETPHINHPSRRTLQLLHPQQKGKEKQMHINPSNQKPMSF